MRPSWRHRLIALAALFLAAGPTAALAAAAGPYATAAPTCGPSPVAGPSPSPTPGSGPRTSPIPSPTPTSGLVVTPCAGLADGQYVKIAFLNLLPFEGMSFQQCIVNWTNANTDCTAINTRIYGETADQNGAGTIYFPVHAYGNSLLETPASIAIDRDPRTGNPNAPHVQITCDQSHPCAVVAFSNYHHTFQTNLYFAASPDACPPIGPNVVGGSGSAASTRAMYRWTAATCTGANALQVTYITSNEHAAYDDLAKGLTEFGVTGLGPYPPAADSGGPTYKLAPLTASGVVLAYRAYDIFTQSQITNLTLTPDQIAQIFMGQLNNFNVVRGITALNPGITFPPRTNAVARAEFNSETYIFTNWLKAVAPNSWKPPTSPAPDIFPATGIDLKFGERAAALDVVDPPAGFVPDVVYIGVMDSSTAAFYGLPTVNIAMPGGYTISANPASILKGIGDMAQLSDGTLLPQWANSDPAAWPMPNVTYMLAPTSKIDPARGKSVAAFLRYAVQDGQKSVTGLDGYVPLPATLVADSLAIADLVPVPSATSGGIPSGPSIPALPPLPSPPGGTVGGAGSGPACSGSDCGGSSSRASDTRVASLSYTQGLGLAAAAGGGPGVPPPYALPSLLGLTVLSTVVGVGLQLWSLFSSRAAPIQP